MKSTTSASCSRCLHCNGPAEPRGANGAPCCHDFFSTAIERCQCDLTLRRHKGTLGHGGNVVYTHQDLRLSRTSTVRAYRALHQAGVARVNVGERLIERNALGKSHLKVMVAIRAREIRPSGMKRGACGIVGIVEAGLSPVGKSMESPPDLTILHALHFYCNIPSAKRSREVRFWARCRERLLVTS